MKIAVTDTNIFIDLIKTGLLPKLFQTEYLVHTTSEVINELLDHQHLLVQEFISDGKLAVSAFSSAEISEIESQGVPAGLSLVDVGIFYLCQKSGKLLYSE